MTDDLIISLDLCDGMPYQGYLVFEARGLAAGDAARFSRQCVRLDMRFNSGLVANNCAGPGCSFSFTDLKVERIVVGGKRQEPTADALVTARAISSVVIFCS